MVELNNLYEYFGSSQESSAKSLKKFIADSFGNQVCFTPAVGLHGSPLVAHANDVNPIDYVLSSLV